MICVFAEIGSSTLLTVDWAAGFAASKAIVHQLPPYMDGAHAEMLAILDNNEPIADSYFADNDLIAAGAMILLLCMVEWIYMAAVKRSSSKYLLTLMAPEREE